MLNVLTFITLLLSTYLLLRILEITRLSDFLLAFYCLASANIIISGYVLSHLHQLSYIRSWAILSFSVTLVFFFIALRKKNISFYSSPRLDKLRSSIFYVKEKLERMPVLEKILLLPLFLTVLMLGFINLADIIFIAPSSWDSLNYHLARVAYYLQYNSLNYFDANYWAQIIHPKNSSILILYTYLISGESENLTRIVQFISYWVAVYSVYAISRKTGSNVVQSVFSALVSALLVEWLMESTTTLNDMLITAYTGITVYFLFTFKNVNQKKYLVIASISMGLFVGTKANSLLLLPAIALISIWVIFQTNTPFKSQKRNLFYWGFFVLISISVFAIPSGYFQNYLRFGHPMGPETIRSSHSFEGQSFQYIVSNGSKNFVRYGFDFLSLDGLPTIVPVEMAQKFIRYVPSKLIKTVGIELETEIATRSPFESNKLPRSGENHSYWGVFGFGFVLVSSFIISIGAVKSSNDVKVLILASILFWIAQSYSSPYSGFRGRYFMALAIFLLPTIGVLLHRTRNKMVYAYLFSIVLLGCVSAISSVLFKNYQSLISLQHEGREYKSVFIMDRMEQMLSNKSPNLLEPLTKFDQIVPNNAIVAVFWREGMFEYPLFGEKLTRTILPINSFEKGLLPIPLDADFLLYSRDFPCANVDDLYLGEDLFLRQLSDTNNQCP